MKEYAIVLALASLSLVFAGCVSNAGTNATATATLNASLQTEQANNAQLVADKAALQAQLQQVFSDRDNLSVQLAVSQQQLLTARNVSRTQLTAVLSSLTGNDSKVTAAYGKLSSKYSDVNTYGCVYYLGGGGYYTNVGNVTIPLGCGIMLLDMVNYAGSYLAVANSTGSTAAVAQINAYLNASA